jgi:hypothetical protein
MKQMVVGLMFVAACFTVGPLIANKVGPVLSDALIARVTPPTPCPSATATAKPHRPKHHGKRPHTKRAKAQPPKRPGQVRPGHRKHQAKPKPSALPSASSTCAPTPEPARR